VADGTRNHPVPQPLFGGVVGTRQAWVVQRPDDRFAINEHLAAEFVEFDEGTVSVGFAQGVELSQGWPLLLGQLQISQASPNRFRERYREYRN